VIQVLGASFFFGCILHGTKVAMLLSHYGPEYRSSWEGLYHLTGIVTVSVVIFALLVAAKITHWGWRTTVSAASAGEPENPAEHAENPAEYTEDYDEELYVRAADELQSGPRAGLLIKCGAESGGDEQATRALYIQRRVEEFARGAY